MKKLICCLSAVMMIAVFCAGAYADSGIGVEPGEAMPDFTVSLTDGSTATLSALLKEKDLVVLNVFASWCGPCEREFPDMEEVYQANRDRMVILSVSGDPEDTMDVIAAYKDSHGLSFPMGLAGDALDFLTVPGFPTTIFIDHDGKVGFIKVGAFVNPGDFAGKVGTFLSAGYDGKPLATEKAVSIMPYIFGASLLTSLLLIIGRWGLLRKAGKPGWHSLIPFLNSYQEYALCWNGWFGVIADLCFVVSLFSSGVLGIFHYVLMAAPFLLGIPQSLRLAKAFGQGKLVAVLLMIPGLREIGRCVLGLSKAQYRPIE